MTTPPVAAPSADLTVAVTGSAVDPVTGMGRALGLGDPGQTGGPDELSGPDELIRREQQLLVGVRRAPSERVRLIRRIVTDTRMVPVQVRREVLEVERTPIDADYVGGVSTPGRDVEPLEVVLHEEVPVFTFEVRPVERVRVRIEEIAGETVIREQVASEQVEIVNIPPSVAKV